MRLRARMLALRKLKMLARPSLTRLSCRTAALTSSVPPVDKNASDAKGKPGQVHSSPSGDSIVYYSGVPFPGIAMVFEFPSYLSTRTTEGWSMQSGNAPTESGGESKVFGLTEDNGELLDRVGSELDEEFLLAPGAELEVNNTYVHDNATDQYRLLAACPSKLHYDDSTPDGYLAHSLYEH